MKDWRRQSREPLEVLLWCACVVSMSLCRLYSIHSLGSRPANWRWIPKERYNVGLSIRASGGRSTTRRERNQSSRPEDDSEGDGFVGNSLWDSNAENVRRRNRNRSDGREASSQTTSTPDWLTPKKDWTFNSEEIRSEEKRNKPDEELPWWKSSKSDDKYDDDESEEDDDDDEEDDDYDVKSVSGEFFINFLCSKARNIYFCSRRSWMVFGVVRCMKCQYMYISNDRN